MTIVVGKAEQEQDAEKSLMYLVNVYKKQNR